MSLSPLERELLQACRETIHRCDHGPYSENEDDESGWVEIHVSREMYDRIKAAIAKAEALAKPDLDGAETP